MTFYASSQGACRSAAARKGIGPFLRLTCIRKRIHYKEVKARDLKAELRRMGFWDTGKGSKHEKWTNGVYSIAVPRHKEISEGTARAILKEAAIYGRKVEL